MKGSTYKRCKCRDADGKELGAGCPKLKRSTGAWNSKHGVWYFQLELEPGPNGKRRKVRKGGFETSDDAEAALTEAKAKAARGIDPKAKLLVGKFLDDWLNGNRGLRKNTRNSYAGHIENYLKPHLGHVELGRLRVAHLDDMFTAIHEQAEQIKDNNAARWRLRDELAEVSRGIGQTRQREHRAEAAKLRKRRRELLDELKALPPFKRPPEAATLQRIRATLRTALSDAQDQELITVNVAKLVKLETGKRPKGLLWNAERVAAWTREYEERAGEDLRPRFDVWRYLPRPSRVMIWSPAQTGAFLDAALPHRLYAAFHLIAFRGLRRGEACGLEWEDLDLDAGTLMVRTQRVMISYTEIEEGAPKTDASEDTIPLDTATVTALRRHKAQQAAEKLAWGEAWVSTGKVFTRENGEALHPDTLFMEFLRTAYAAGLPPIRLHDLRHGAATLMLAGGADMKVVQALLRHSSITITSDTYTSVLPEVARQAAENAAALVPRQAVGDDSPGTPGLPTASHGGVERLRPPVPGAAPQVGRPSVGGSRGTRTHNLRIKSPELCH